MQEIIMGGILAFLVTYFSIPVIITVANQKKLFDEPDDKRKIHTRPIPSFGGLGIFIGFTLCLLLTVNFWKGAPEFQFYLAAFLVSFFLGIKDDILVLSPFKKFLGQVVVASILIFKANLLITNMHGFLGVEGINASFSYILTFFALVVIINSFNLIDGVDGLAGGIGLVTSAVFGTFFFVNGDIAYAVLGFGLASSLLAFLIYNFHPAKIFMGDTGSLMIGLVNAILVVRFIQNGSIYSLHPVSAAPAVGFGIMLLPLLDTLRVFGIRMIKGKSPFSPDRNHIHHLLLDRGFNHRTVTFTCVSATAIIAALAFSCQFLGTTILIASLVACFFACISLLLIMRNKVKLRVIKSERTETIKTEAKNVRLVSVLEKQAVSFNEE